MFFTDFHNHLQNISSAKELQSIQLEAEKVRVRRFVCNGTHPDDWERVAALAEKSETVVPCFGVHPWFVGDACAESVWDCLEHYLDQMRPRCGLRPAIGEIGLDAAIRPRQDAMQQLALEKQLRIAMDRALPVMLHVVRAIAPLLAQLRRWCPPVFLMHRFSGPVECIDECVHRGGYFSVGCNLLKLNDLRNDHLPMPPVVRRWEQVLRAIPEERLLLESDVSGDISTAPSELPRLCHFIAQRRGVLPEYFERCLFENGERFFASWPRLNGGER